MVGGDAAFDPAAEEAGAAPDEAGEPVGDAGEGVPDGSETGVRPGQDGDRGAGRGEPRGLPDLLTAYLAAEQRLGRIDAAADIDAAASLVVGAMHGQILPKVLFAPPGAPVTIPPGLSARLAHVVLEGIAPGARSE
jgi:hypothetical protein